jgi:hypothetical protein
MKQDLLTNKAWGSRLVRCDVASVIKFEPVLPDSLNHTVTVTDEYEGKECCVAEY